MTRLRKVLGGAWSVVFFVALCQGMRVLVQRWPGILVCNTEGAFGWEIPFHLLVSAGALFLFGVQWWKEQGPVGKWGWALLLSGGISNLFERIFFGCVIDYLTLPFIPLFNIADVLLTVGTLMLLWKFLKQ